ncbi:MAG: ABC transporter substrate-binding protein [Bacillota bacterium]
MFRVITHLVGVTVLVGAVTSAVASGNGQPLPPREKVTLQLKWYHQFQFAGYYAAQAQGYYAQEGLDVTIREGDADHPPIREVLAGNADFGVSDADVLLEYLQGKPLVALGAIFQHSPYILMTRADSGIRTPSDLRGKTIMLEDEQGIVQMKAMFKREGMPLSAVHVIRHSWKSEDLIEGRVAALSAYSTVEPYQLRVNGIEPHMIRAMDYGIDFYGDTLFTTREQIDRHPERVAAFRRASLKGWEYAMAHPDEIIELILRMPTVQQHGLSREHLRYEAHAMEALILPGLVDIGHMNPGRWEAIARIYADLGIIPRAPESVSSFLFNPDAPRTSKWLLPVLIGLGVAALGGVWTLLWNLQLKRVVTRRTAELRRSEEQMKAAKLCAEQAKATAETAKAAAEDASRAKDHFLAVLSHELRTPLTPVLTTASILGQDDELPVRYHEDVEMIRRNVELEARLIDDLLDVTRIVRGKLELYRKPVPLCDIIQRAVEVCMPDIQARGLHFGVDAPDRSFVVEADAARLQQVFWNLLKNSIKFTPQSGCVGIRCRGTDDRVLVEINDSGEGIDPAVLPHIFNAFEQGGTRVTRQFGGLGLGLTITKGLVEMHGGSISAHSDGKGKGATFRIELPLIPSDESLPSLAPDTSRATADTGAGTRCLRILLVEDHGDTARIMRRLLMSDGHEVQTAGDVAAALSLIEAGGAEFDLLISDLGLPDGSGHDLMRAIRTRGYTLPGIALSGFGQEEDTRRSREAGFAAHLTKPTSPDRLAEAIVSLTIAPREPAVPS